MSTEPRRGRRLRRRRMRPTKNLQQSRHQTREPPAASNQPITLARPPLQTYQHALGTISFREADPNEVEDLEEGLARALPRPVHIVEDMRVKPEFRGHPGSWNLMRDFLKEHGSKTLVSQAYPYEEDFNSPEWRRRQKNLIDAYQRFGFVHVGAGWMYRLPDYQKLVDRVYPGKES